MHIFRWLMSHPIITAWVLAALAILLNLNMGGKNSHTNIEHEQAQAGTSHVVETGEVTKTKEARNAAKDNLHVAAPVAHGNTMAEDKQMSGENGHNSHQASEKNHQDHSVVSEQSVAKGAQASTSLKAHPAEKNVKKAMMNATSVGDVKHSNLQDSQSSNELTTDDLKSMSSEDLLKLAREAFWQNEKDKSATIYRALVKRDPSVLSYKGELANVLWHQNKQKESATLYAEIAIPMLKEGKSREVANMLGFIGVFFPEKASEIHRSMSE